MKVFILFYFIVLRPSFSFVNFILYIKTQCTDRLILFILSLFTGAEVGSILTSVTANDVDTYPALKYALVQDENIFSIDRYSGKVVLNKALDFESQKSYIINVTASDNEHVATTTLTVQVTDINDNSPVFEEVSYSSVLPGKYYTFM